MPRTPLTPRQQALHKRLLARLEALRSPWGGSPPCGYALSWFRGGRFIIAAAAWDACPQWSWLDWLMAALGKPLTQKMANKVWHLSCERNLTLADAFRELVPCPFRKPAARRGKL